MISTVLVPQHMVHSSEGLCLLLSSILKGKLRFKNLNDSQKYCLIKYSLGKRIKIN